MSILIVSLCLGAALHDGAEFKGEQFQLPDDVLAYRYGVEGEFQDIEKGGSIAVRYDIAEVSELLSTRTSPQWRHPRPGLPAASIICVERGNAKRSEKEYHTFFNKQHELPVLSLITPMENLLGRSDGLLVPGNAILHAPATVVERYQRDEKWWKYPGNYHFRGKQWERPAELQVFDPKGVFGVAQDYKAKVRVRVNGNNTRGFPDKALRLYLPNDALGFKRLILRAAGNDHDRMYMRDALQHRLCEGLPFDVMGAQPVVLYLNGAYWGLKYIRPRMDEVELARRYGFKKKDITILEDMVEYYRGNGGEVRRFWSLVDSLESLSSEPDQLIRHASENIDLNNFLEYMSAQMILGNRDWPFQNLKYWKYTGAGRDSSGFADGRWRFIMGDSDLAFAYEGEGVVGYDMFAHVNANGGAIARLFKALMKHEELKDRFVNIMQRQLSGPLSSTEVIAQIEEIQGSIASEMEWHIDRWQRPADVEAWQSALNLGKEFARRRPNVMLAHLETFRRTTD